MGCSAGELQRGGVAPIPEAVMADRYCKTLADFTLDDRLQMRADIDYEVVDEYVGCLDALPPIKAVWDGEKLWLWDGFHTYLAHKKAGRPNITCEVTKGAFSDAMLLAAGANHGHGQRRTNEDKRIAVTRLLQEAMWAERSDHWIAEQCHVSNHLVADVRIEIDPKPKIANNSAAQPVGTPTTSAGGNSPTSHRTGKDGKKQPAKKKQPERVCVLNGLIVCARCKRVGKPVRNCPACEEARETQARKNTKKKGPGRPPKAKPLDWAWFDRAVGAMNRFFLESGSADQDGRKALMAQLEEFHNAAIRWRKKEQGE